MTSFGAFDKCNVYSPLESGHIRRILDNEPQGENRQIENRLHIGLALRTLLFYMLNSRVMKLCGWAPEPVSKWELPGEWGRRVDQPGQKLEAVRIDYHSLHVNSRLWATPGRCTPHQ